ncbi:unnamed protein product [marine sediment metagenome]|uniref:Uncharacterized protein n=1 Tax=marine sediment metagenome TaxID=412755 RepID=X1RRK3_9ZZZZ
MYMSVNPLTGKAVDSRQNLVFDITSMSFVSLPKGKKLIRNPLRPNELVIGSRVSFNPLKPNEIVTDGKLIFDPLKGEYIRLKNGEKLVYDNIECKFVVKRKRI